jgi:hypothetical protein
MRSESRRAAAAILNDAAETLQTAQWGLTDLTGTDPRRRVPGLRNIIVFGRAVTNVLQNLRSAVGAQTFNDWYLPVQEEMRNDELLRYFYKLRSEILKEGSLQTTTSMYIEHLDISELRPLMEQRPAGAKDFFIGDQLGGSGWEVELPDGTTSKYYVDLPQHMLTTTLHFPDPPQNHRGAPLQDTSVEALAKHYLDYLADLINQAVNRFAKST